MLKFATKKPPRLKHCEQATVSAHLDQHGRSFSDEGSGYLKGDFTRFERINGDDMIDSANQSAECRRPVQSVGIPNNWEAQESSGHATGQNVAHTIGQNVGHTIGQNVGHTNGHNIEGRGSGQPNIQWKAYNVKYGKVGVEKEIEYAQVPAERHVGLSRNGGQYLSQRSEPQYVDQRSQFNPGYSDHTLDNRGPYDVNRNIHSDGINGFESARYYPKGSGYQYPVADAQLPRSRSHIHGQDCNANQQNPYISQSHNLQHVGRVSTASHRLPHESPFPAPMMMADNAGNYGNYGPAYSVDSSMSIDSMSTSGDRSSKSMSETLDYDMLLELPQVTKRGLDLKPPVPHKHRHVHVGRGTHGVCEGAVSPVRPGSTESQMTSSLRKSPSGMKSGHHVRWGPAVVNSNQNIDGQMIGPQTYLEPPVAKKGKKKTSLRSLLNLPKFPLSDDESADDLPQSGYTGQNARKEPNVAHETVLHGGTLRKLLGYHRLRKKPIVAPSQPVTTNELASLRYKNDYRMIDNFKDTRGKGSMEREHILRLHITEANKRLPQCALLNGYGGKSERLEQDYDTVQQTGAIRYPIMHSGRDQSIFGREAVPESSNRSPVNSVRPFLINGQANETHDYDFSTEAERQKSEAISVKLRDRNKVNGLHQGNVLSPQLYDKNAQTTNALQTATATFDTYVTLGRPTESKVTFDTFVTLGRPFATSTPIPNANFGNDHNLGQEFHSNSAVYDDVDSRRNWLPNFGLPGTRGQVESCMTQSWNYGSPGSQGLTSMPLVTHSVQASSRKPVMHAGTGVPEWSHEGRLTGMGSPGAINRPYHLDNNEGLAVSSSAFITTAPLAYGPQGTQSANLGQLTNDLELLNQRSLGQTKQNENVQFKDTCTYHELDTGDYDDDEVFFNLGLTPTPSLEERSQTVRRKLDFEGLSNSPVVTSCVPQLNHELNHDDTLNHNYSGFPKVQAVPGITQQRGTMSSNLNEMIARDHVDGGEMPCILDLVYITERIISMSFASEEHDNTYKYNLKEVTRMLKTKHGDNYLVINISEKKPELAKHCPQVLDYGWPDNLAPPLERLCSICKAIDQWMGKDPNYVIVVHCKGGRGRIAVVIAAYMRYSNICASADQALDRFAMKRFYDDKLGGLPQPSQRRYVHYFAGLLSGAIQINSSALYLHHILIHGVPNFDTRGGCRPFIKVYQGMHPIFTSGVYNVTDNMQKVCISISPGIPLRGDILIKCYHKKNNAGQREMIWGCQFHTCAISHNSLVFSKNELDYGINDPRFPDSGKVEFVFGNNSEGLVQVADFKSDVTVPVDDSTEALTRWDSYENFGKMVDGKETDVNANGLQISHHQQQQQQQQHGVDSFRVTQLDHNQGPVDGSLYAQVNKRKLESQIIQNGSTKLQNGGSYSSSIDSGISAFSVPMGTSTTHKTSDSWSYNTRERDFHQPNLSSSMNKSYSSSTSPRSAKVALDEQTQLDQILSDLLSDQAFVSQKSSPGTRSFKMVEEHTSPEGTVVVQRGDVTYKVPEVRSENHYTVKTESKTVTDDKYKPVNAFTYTPSSPEMSRSFEPLRSPQSPKAPYRTDYENNYKKESYSYQTNGPSSLSDGEHSLSWLQQQQAKMREKSSERDQSRHRNEQILLEELKKSQTQNKYFQKRSQSEDESSKVSPPLQNGPVSPYSYTVSRTHTYNTDKSPNDTSFRPHDTLPVATSHTTYITEQTSSKVSNKPPPSPNLQRTVTPTFSAPPVLPPQRTSSRDYMQHQQQQQTQQQQTQQQQTQQQQQQTRNRSNSYQQSTSSWRSETQTQPRFTQRHNSESAYDREQFEKQHESRQHESRQQFRTPPLSPRSVSPHTFQSYKTVYKTMHNDEPDFSQQQPIEAQLEKQMMTDQQAAVQDVNKPHYITEVIVQRTGGSDSKNSTLNRNETDRHETDNRLDALEKSLQAASHSILASSPWQQQQQQKQQQQQQQNVMKQEVRQFETRTYETKTEQRQEQRHEQQRVQPVQVEQPPKKIEVTEEDRITLKPIGPGVQQLEPEGSHSGSTLGRDSTLGRATTPSFPTSPGVASAVGGGSSVASPTDNLHSDKMQYQTQYNQQQSYQTNTLPHSTSQLASQQYQTNTLPHGAPLPVSQTFQTNTLPHQQQQQQQQFQQQRQYQQYQTSSSQQYHTQQYSTGSNSQDGSLHVDTNPRMLMTQPARSPSSPGSPPSPGNLNTLRQQLHVAHNMSNNAVSPGPHSATGQSSPSVYFGLSRRGSLTSLVDSEAMHTTPRFVKDTSRFWYKPSISREEAIIMLKDKAPGTFVVRDSNSFPGAFGLALKVATLPPNVQTKSTGDPQADLVRHFLIEPTSKGVRLRGCSNEPVFGSLASLVYQHSLTPLALPCKLVLPENDASHIVTEISPTTEMPNSASQLLAQGAACNVVYLNSVDTESLTGPQAVSRACKVTFENPPPKTTQVHFKVSNQGITLTDNQRKLFFRRHYPVAAVTYCGGDPEDRKWRRDTDLPGVQADARVFGFVARKQGSISDNCCHLFSESDPDQPASAIVNFVTKVMIGQGKIKS